jgi:hypothetical protein
LQRVLLLIGAAATFLVAGVCWLMPVPVPVPLLQTGVASLTTTVAVAPVSPDFPERERLVRVTLPVVFLTVLVDVVVVVSKVLP